MPADYSPSYAKNIIRRSLTAVLDPHPTKSQIAALTEHFGDTCAYCGKRIHVYPKDAQLDHIDASGPNNISNRVYACEDCNEKEKRDENWRVFLRSKSESDDEYSRRARLIERWLDIHHDVYTSMDAETKTRLIAEIEAVIVSFDRSIANIRSMRPKSQRNQSKMNG